MVPWRLYTHDFLHGELWYGVEEKDEEHGQCKYEDHLEDDPLVVMPDDVANALQWVQEPHERRIRPAVNGAEERIIITIKLIFV